MAKECLETVIASTSPQSQRTSTLGLVSLATTLGSTKIGKNICVYNPIDVY